MQDLLLLAAVVCDAIDCPPFSCMVVETKFLKHLVFKIGTVENDFAQFTYVLQYTSIVIYNCFGVWDIFQLANSI